MQKAEPENDLEIEPVKENKVEIETNAEDKNRQEDEIEVGREIEVVNQEAEI